MRDAQVLLHRGQMKAAGGEAGFSDSARSFWRCFFLSLRRSSGFQTLGLPSGLSTATFVDRSHHPARNWVEFFSKESCFFSWSLYRFFGAPRFRFPALSSPNKTAFGMRESSILATCPAQRSCCLRRMDSMLGSSAFSRTSSLDT